MWLWNVITLIGIMNLYLTICHIISDSVLCDKLSEKCLNLSDPIIWWRHLWQFLFELIKSGTRNFSLSHLRPGVHNSYLVAGQKLFCCQVQGPKLTCFYIFKGCFWGISKLNNQNRGLCGPDKWLPRATFGPRAVCCACLP